MRVFPAIVVFTIIFASMFDSSTCQLRLGSNGMKFFPPINLSTIFRILKSTWNSLTSPSKALPKAKEARGATQAEKRIGSADDFRTREEIIAGLTEEEKLILNELKIKVKISCYSHNLDCNNITMVNYIRATNGSLTEDESKATLKLTNSSSLNFQVSELIDSKIENKITVKNDSSLENESKTPTLWPYPFASGGWLMSYVIVNSVLMGLYIFLAWPYFVTGRIVDRIVKPSTDSAETTTSRGTLSESAMDEMQQYMGYTSYGDSDMLMSYMMSDNDDGKDDIKDDDETKGKRDEQAVKSTYTNGGKPQEDEGGSGETKHDDSSSSSSSSSNSNNSNENNNNNNNNNSNLGKEKHANYKLKVNKTTDDNQSGETEQDNKIEDDKDDKDDKDEHTKCIENIMCLRPVYGARALSSASLALKLLEWIPGLDSLPIGKRFKRNVSRFGRAIEKGKINDCYDYLCPKDNKDKPTR